MTTRAPARTTTLVAAGVTLIGLLLVALLLPVPYVTVRPGPTIDTLGSYQKKPIIVFGKGVKTYPTSGSLRLTTVSVTRADARLSLTQAFRAYLDPHQAVVPRDLIYPQGQTAKQATQETTAQMTGSKQTSEVAALRLAGYDVPQRLEADTVLKDGPADGIVKAGDVVLAVDGTAVRTPDAAVKRIRGVEPGTVVTLRVERAGRQQDLRITTQADPTDKTKARVGIGLAEDYDFPFTVTNNVGQDIGGPSAGTMFALAIYDKLTPGALTDGAAVAGTGEIDAAGKVGSIGGIQQKIAGAADAKASVFLVPAGNCAEAKQGDDFGLTLLRVATLEQAVSSLQELAADKDAKVPLCS